MLGANVGTTLIVQLLSFKVAEVAPALILIGVLMFRRATAGPRDFGRVLIGLGLMLMALHQFVDMFAPYEDAPSFRLIFGAIATDPVLDVIIAAGLTWAAHSSVATVLLAVTFAANSTVPPAAAFALVLGANLGSAINPLLESATGGDPASKRLPVGNLLNRIVGVALGLAALPYIGPWLVSVDADNGRAVADFHFGFNVLLALVFFPLLKPYAAALRRWLPSRINQSNPALPMYLDPAARETPVIALGAAAREALRLADVLQSMLSGLRGAFAHADRRQINETKRLDDVLDNLNTEIKSYLISIDPDALSDSDQRRVNEILTFSMNMEQAGDIVDRDLLGVINKVLKRGIAFSREGEAELLLILDRLTANLAAAASLFMREDERAARLLVAEKEVFRGLEAAATASHFERLRAGRVETAETSSLHLDALRDLKRINNHLIASAAYSVLESKGALLPSRLRQDG
jgi:phosphate:Na+ symporter